MKLTTNMATDQNPYEDEDSDDHRSDDEEIVGEDGEPVKVPEDDQDDGADFFHNYLF